MVHCSRFRGYTLGPSSVPTRSQRCPRHALCPQFPYTRYKVRSLLLSRVTARTFVNLSRGEIQVNAQGKTERRELWGIHLRDSGGERVVQILAVEKVKVL